MIPALGDSPRDAPDGPPASTRILIVDEAVPVRRALREILRKLGISDEDVDESTSAEEALDAFRRDPPHVVFTELVGVHPEDGLEVIHEMLDRAPHAKVVLVTAEPRDSAEVRAAMRAGAFALLEKPIRHEKVRQVMQEVAAEEGGIERLR